MIKDNPAERLLGILEEGRSLSAGKKCREIWSNILEINDKNESLLMSRLGKAMELPNQIIEELKKIDGTDEDSYKHWSTCVNRAFMQQNLNANWETFINQIDAHTIPYLKISKQLLAAHANIKSIPENELIKIKEEVEELLQIIRDSNISDDIRSYLIGSLSKMLNSIIEYKITGYEPILSNIDEIVGHAVTDSNFREEMKSNEVGSKVWGTLHNISAVVTLATGLPQLAKDAIKLLTN